MPSDPPAPAHRLFVQLWRLSRALRQQLEPILAERYGLELRDYLILGALHRGVSYPTELAEYLGLSKDMVSRQLQALLQTGLVRRSIDPDDSRRTRLELTPAGAAKRREARQGVAETLGPMLERLGPEPAEQLLASLETFADLVTTLPAQGELHVNAR